MIPKATWPENQKDTREKIRNCRAGEKEGQVKSEVKYMKEGSGEEEESSHGVENLEAGDGINKNKDMKEFRICY